MTTAIDVLARNGDEWVKWNRWRGGYRALATSLGFEGTHGMGRGDAMTAGRADELSRWSEIDDTCGCQNFVAELGDHVTHTVRSSR
jgi:hypothetical protein